MPMENARDFELIQKHYGNELTDTERSEVEYRLKEDPAFISLEAEHRKFALAIRRNHLQEKLAQLKTLEAALPAPAEEAKVVSLRSKWIPVSIAATIVVLITVGYFITRDTRPMNERLYAANFEPFDSPGSGLTRGNDDIPTLKDRAYDAYDAGLYPQAAELFEQISKEKDDAIVDLCLGNAHLANGNAAEAEAVFQHILTNHVDLVTPAKWYLALTYLRQGKMERTRSVLWEISKSSTYGDKARQLLNELE